MQKRIYFPGLDGLRGIAAIAVLFGHMVQSRPWVGLKASSYQTSGHLAQMAVTFFFVLSGFLITYLLIKEKEKIGTINVRMFYVRRILRIWPLYFLVVIVSFLLYFFTGFFEEENTFIYLSLFLYCVGLANIVLDLSIGLPSTDPLWSIGVEEQFYFFWPLLLKRFTNTRKVLIFTILIYLMFKTIIIVYFHLDLPHKSFFLTFITHFRIDSMAIGGLGAYFLHTHPDYASKFIRKYLDVVIVCVIILLLAYEVQFSHLTYEVYAVLFLLLIYNTSINNSSIVNFRGKWLTWLGKISFGIYMYHMFSISFFHYLVRKNMFPENIGYVEVLYNFSIPVLTITIAAVSYKYFEKRILRLKDKYTVVSSGG